ncbi:hypothetical protein FOCC_FOCC005588 [Frankliniella occidentalis]|nr:hypothetical protein FOCC_FOCC005588 [Frankliniella occidentalis]
MSEKLTYLVKLCKDFQDKGCLFTWLLGYSMNVFAPVLIQIGFLIGCNMNVKTTSKRSYNDMPKTRHVLKELPAEQLSAETPKATHQKKRRKGTPESLYKLITKPNSFVDSELRYGKAFTQDYVFTRSAMETIKNI